MLTRKTKLFVAVTAAFAGVLGTSSVAPAATTLATPAGVTLDASVPFFPVGNLINNSGLSERAANIGNYAGITHAGSGGGNSWVTTAFFPDYYTGGGAVPVQTFDLGQTLNLTDVVAWNYSVPGNAARQVTATFSTNGPAGPFGSPAVFEVPQAAGPAHTVSLGGSVVADAVRFFEYDTNWVGFGPGGDRTGLNEVKFIGSNLGSVSHWKLDEPSGTSGADSVADSVNGNPGTTVGTVGFGGPGATPDTGTSGIFTGAGNIDRAENSSLNPQDFTLTAWAKPSNTGSGGFRSVVTSRDDDGVNGNKGYILYKASNGNWQFWTGNGATGGAGWSVLNGPKAQEGAWSHLAISFDSATGTKSLYVNGQLATSAAQPHLVNAVENFHIGGGADSGTSFRFDGNIDDVKFFDEALSAGAIQSLFNGQTPNIALGKTYAYSTLPTFSGGTFYIDDQHVQATDVFDTGDLTDGQAHPGTVAPTVPAQNTLVGWGDPVGIPTEITFDLEGTFSLDSVRLGTHTWAPFANGAPDDVSILVSSDGVNFNSVVGATFLASDVATNGHHDLEIDFGSLVLADFVRLSFDGGAVLTGNTPNKWMLDEIAIFGVAVPEPASMSLLGLAGLGLLRRRRPA